MNPENAYLAGYAAYWDGYDQFCMSKFLTGNDFFSFSKGWSVARNEDQAKAKQLTLA
tara:strand:+ start:147 stop:317 length:171 start_codon:yes stop_codon:yes gene_type:complete